MKAYNWLEAYNQVIEGWVRSVAVFNKRETNLVFQKVGIYLPQILKGLNALIHMLVNKGHTYLKNLQLLVAASLFNMYELLLPLCIKDLNFKHQPNNF